MSWRCDRDLKYADGPALYTATTDLEKKPGNAYILDAGLIPGTAAVRINGVLVGQASLPPGKLDITSNLHSGLNSINIEYQPAPRNSMIGRALQGDKREKYLKRRKTEIIPAGICGPVRLIELVPSEKYSPISRRP